MGFGQSAFIQEQLSKFKPFFEFKIVILFVFKTRMYFFFFICEAKYGAAIFDLIDRQSAQKMIGVLRPWLYFSNR